MESGDKCSIYRSDNHATEQTANQLNIPQSHMILNKLNMPIRCLDNHQTRQHYLEEYAAKYSKAKHLLSNARKKQRKIIMTYYDEKEKQNDIDKLQTIKQCLLEENEKIKRFKEALKEKLVIYQERIEFLKDTEFWSTYEMQQITNDMLDSIEIDGDHSQDSTTRIIHSQTLNDNTNTHDSPDRTSHRHSILSDKASDDTSHLQLDYLEPNSISLISEDYYLTDNFWKHQDQSSVHLRTNINEMTPSLQVNTKQKSNDQLFLVVNWMKKYRHRFISILQNIPYNRLTILSMISMIVLTVLLVFFVNDLLERFLRYVTTPKTSIELVSTSPLFFCRQLLSDLHNWTISWFYPL